MSQKILWGSVVVFVLFTVLFGFLGFWVGYKVGEVLIVLLGLIPR